MYRPEPLDDRLPCEMPDYEPAASCAYCGGPDIGTPMVRDDCGDLIHQTCGKEFA